MKALSTNDIAAVIELMTDTDDTDVLTLLRRQLRAMDTDTLRAMQEEARFAPDHVAMEIDLALQVHRWTEIRDDFRDLCRAAEFDLWQALSALARFSRTPADPVNTDQALGRLHMLCDCQLGDTHRNLDRATLMGDFLGRELGFCGNQDNFHDPANSFIDQVLKTRRGNSLSLAALYLVLGRRLGIRLAGVALRDYFVVGVLENPTDTDPLLFLDPFRRGQVLSRLDCAEVVYQQGADFQEEMLKPVTSRLIFSRLLHTLYDIYEDAADLTRADMILQYIHLWESAPTSNR